MLILIPGHICVSQSVNCDFSSSTAFCTHLPCQRGQTKMSDDLTCEKSEVVVRPFWLHWKREEDVSEIVCCILRKSFTAMY